MRIALLTLSFPPQTGGVQTYLAQIFQRLGQKHEVVVVTPVGSGASEVENIRRMRLPGGRALAYWRALRQLGPDRIVVGHAHPQILLPAALYRRAPYLAVAYGNDYLAAQARWHRPLFNRLLARARPLVTIAHSNARTLEQFGAGSAVVVYPGADPDHFTPGDWHQVRGHVLLSICRLVPRKGLDTVLTALARLRPEYPDISYIIAGDGPDRARLEAMVTDLGLSGAVRFMGRVAAAELPAVYRGAGIFVMPVREEEQGQSIEGFGIVYLEASASGLPVVAGRSGGAAEAVQQGETGLLVEPQPVPVAAAIKKLLDDPARGRRMGQAGRSWVQVEMNWDRATEEMERALER